PPAFNLPSVSELRILGWKTDALADYYGLTPRGLRKRFNTEIGLGPKFWLQLNRFDSVIRDELNTIGLAAAAAAHGYADQAHMSSDFRRFAGRPPRNYLVNRRDQDAPDEAPHFIPAAP
ncbi:MAG: helix-turn-helix domain-containing protein, partial [Pseudomonadota bacterium]